MRKTFIIFSLGLSLAVVSCKKKDTTTTGGLSNQSMSADINGTLFSSSGTNIGEATIANSNNTQFSYGFTGLSSGAALSIDVPAVTTGTYFYGDGSSLYQTSLTYNTGKGAIYYSYSANGAASGSVILTPSGSNTISGTFTGTLYNISNNADSVVVTNGKFSDLAY